MAKKTRAHKRSHVKKAAKRKAGRDFFAMFGSRSKLVAAVIASVLLATVSLAYWNTQDKQLTPASISSSEAPKKSTVKNVSTSSPSELADIPPEAFHPEPPTSDGWTIQWLVTDQLGTQRMIFDQPGSLTTMTRHDYLPFGEELTTQGVRTPQLGYNG